MAGHCTTAKFTPLDRMAFYDEARKAFAVVQCSERRPYGCFLLQKVCPWACPSTAAVTFAAITIIITITITITNITTITTPSPLKWS